VVYGSSGGLRAAANQQWRALDFPGSGYLESVVTSLVAGDFDGDGYDDLAVGLDPATDGTGVRNGEVRIIHGSSKGLGRERSQVWRQNSPGLPPTPDTDYDGFGSALVAADFGQSGQDDLAIAARYSHGQRGSVTVLYGSRRGLTAQGSQVWTQDTEGIPGRGAAQDLFGFSLAAGRFGGSRFADLAVGVPGNGGTARRVGPGAVNVLRGSAAGLTSQGSQLWSQSSAGVKGKAAPDERFGHTLAGGRFAGRNTTDLAIGSLSDRGAGEFTGSVNVLYSSPKGLTARGDQLWNRKTKGLAGKHYLDLFFGARLVAGNFGRDHQGQPFDDLAIGASTEYERDGIYANLGVVEVIYGSPSGGLTAKHSQSWRWDSPGVKGDPSPPDSDSFGQSLAAADFGKPAGQRHFDDLAAADSILGTGNSLYGAVSVLYGSGPGLTAAGDQLWTVPALGRSAPSFFAERLAAG
jgi:hypothetical protein